MRSQINKDNTVLFHWSCVNEKHIKLYASIEEDIIELKKTFNETVDYDFLINDIYSFIESNITECKIITLEELLNNEDIAMVETPSFIERIKSHIRNQKIKTIINGN